MITLGLPARETPRPKRRSVWAGTAGGRLQGDWATSIQSPRDELRGHLGKLVERSRDHERNHPLVRRFQNMVVRNIVGPVGILLEVQARTLRGDPHERVNPPIEREFRRWGRPEHCTASGSLGWVGVQAMAVSTTARDGECFLRVLRGWSNPFGFALHFIDPDQVDRDYNVLPAEGRNAVTMGVEHDAWYKPIAYHVLTSHPTDPGARRRERIPADQIIHLMRPRRYGAMRGEPWIAPILTTARHQAGYIEAAVIRARTAAAKMAFITTTDSAVAASSETDAYGNPSATGGAVEADPGAIERLAPGENVVTWDPNYPGGEIGPFNDLLTHYFAAGLDVSATGLSGDLSKVNLSAIRAGRVDEQDGWRQLQGWLIESLHQKVFPIWLQQAVLKGVVSLPSADLTRWTEAVEWRPRGWRSPDPQKDVLADALAVAFGFKTHSQVVAEDGRDYGEQLAQLAREKTWRDELGLEHAMPSQVTIEQESSDDDTGTSPGGDDAASDGERRRSRARLALG